MLCNSLSNLGTAPEGAARNNLALSSHGQKTTTVTNVSYRSSASDPPRQPDYAQALGSTKDHFSSLRLGLQVFQVDLSQAALSLCQCRHLTRSQSNNASHRQSGNVSTCYCIFCIRNRCLHILRVSAYLNFFF